MNALTEEALNADKGYHFVDAPYVEYKGSFPAEGRDLALKKLEEECNRLINVHNWCSSFAVYTTLKYNTFTQEGSEVQVEVVHTKEDVERLCGSSAGTNPSPSEPVRIVTVYAPLGCPCGGTHVKNANEIGRIAVPKMSSKKGVVRISYTLQV